MASLLVAALTFLATLFVGLTALALVPATASAATTVTAYVTNFFGGTVTPIDLTTNTPGTPITVGTNPTGVAFTPDGTKAYVVNANSVTPITVSTNTPGPPSPSAPAHARSRSLPTGRPPTSPTHSVTR